MKRGRKSRRPVLAPLFLGVLLGAGAVLFLLLSPLPAGCRREPPRAAAPQAAPPSSEARPPATPQPARIKTQRRPPADFEPASPAEPAGVLALVLDDVGYDRDALAAIGALRGPVALAVIPSAPHAREAAALAKRRGWDLLVHLPMSPEAGAHESEAIGPLDDDAAIAARVTRALDLVPEAIGLNNHQGSRATADPRVVRAVLTVVRDRGLFFLDSRTTSATVAESEARSLGISTIARDVFLDDESTAAAHPGGSAAALEHAWSEAIATAAAKGRCVVLSHPHRSTLAFLAARAGKSGSPRLVKVSDLVD